MSVNRSGNWSKEPISPSSFYDDRGTGRQLFCVNDCRRLIAQEKGVKALNEDESSRTFQKVTTRRTAIIGAGVAGAAALGWTIKDAPKWRCFSFLGTSKESDDMPGVIGHENLFAEAPFAECHASTLADAKETLVCSWFGGSEEGRADVAIWSSMRLRTGWSEPKLLIEGTGDAGERLPCWNPVLWQQPAGPLHLFYKVGETPRSWWGMAMRSEDGGQSWTTPVRLPAGILGPIKNKPIMLDDGRLLCPSSTEHAGWRAHFEWTADHGRTWQKTAPIGDGETIEMIQPALFVHPGQRLQALCRSRQEFIAEIWSEDGGRTWSEPSLTAMPNPNSGFDGLTLSDGRHLLVHNPVAQCRSPLVASLSEDGKIWREIATLASGNGAFSYPAIIQKSDGLVHISYTNRRTTITHVTIDPQAI